MRPPDGRAKSSEEFALHIKKSKDKEGYIVVQRFVFFFTKRPLPSLPRFLPLYFVLFCPSQHAAWRSETLYCNECPFQRTSQKCLALRANQAVNRQQLNFVRLSSLTSS